jgi:hypothetical protein
VGGGLAPVPAPGTGAVFSGLAALRVVRPGLRLCLVAQIAIRPALWSRWSSPAGSREEI